MKHTARFWGRNMMMLIIVMMIRNLNMKKIRSFPNEGCRKVKNQRRTKSSTHFFLYETMIKIQKKNLSCCYRIHRAFDLFEEESDVKINFMDIFVLT